MLVFTLSFYSLIILETDSIRTTGKPAGMSLNHFSKSKRLTSTRKRLTQLYGEAFHLTTGQIGHQYIAPLIGGFLGEQLGGYGSDKFMLWRKRRAEKGQPGGGKGQFRPEMRLPLAPVGLVVAMAGILVRGAQLQNATVGKWNVTPVSSSFFKFIYIYIY
jgi:hypothetical protein